MSELHEELEKIKEAIEVAFKEAVGKLEELKRLTLDWPVPRFLRSLYRELESIVGNFESSVLEVKRRLREVRKEAEKTGDEVAIDSAKKLEGFMRSKVEEFGEKYRELVSYIEEKHPELGAWKRPRWIAITMLPLKIMKVAGVEVERALRGIAESTTTVVSSIRLAEKDARVIDELVEAGIFKSRSEAVAFFVKRGIEASGEWLDKVREQLAKIRELREQVKRELEREGK